MSLSDVAIIHGKLCRRKVESYSNDPMKVQKKLLKKIVKKNKNCELGKKLNLGSVHSVEDFQNIVPLSTYADYEPYVDRMINKGEKGLMYKGINVQYASSSGSVGKPKMLPKSIKDLWTMQTLGVYMSVGTAAEFLAKRGIKIKKQVGPLALNLSGHKTADGKMSNGAAQIPLRMIKPILPTFCTSPLPLLFPSLDDKLDTSYLHLRFSLERKDVTYIGAIVVTLMTQMFDYLEENWQILCDDIENGTISEQIDCPEALRKKFCKRLKPNPQRAEELRREFEKGFNDPIAPRIWPNLQWAYGMMGSTLSVYVKKVRRAVGYDIPVHNMGYAAAEGFFAAPMELDRDDYVLMAHSLFFEFLPVEENEERAADGAKALLLDQIEQDKLYELIVTNFSGLYRYKVEDVIKVTGMYNNIPIVKLMYRQNLSMNVANEKTTTDMIDAAVKVVNEKTGTELQGYSFYPDFTTKPPRYTMLCEVSSGTADEETRQKMIASLDEAMDDINEKYYKYRRWGMLDRPEVLFLKEGAYVEFNKYLASKGIVLNQIKPVTVINNEDREKFFFSQVVTPSETVDAVRAKYEDKD